MSASQAAQVRWWLSLVLVCAAAVYAGSAALMVLAGGRPDVTLLIVFGGLALMGLPSLAGADRSALAGLCVGAGLCMQIAALAVGWGW